MAATLALMALLAVVCIPALIPKALDVPKDVPLQTPLLFSERSRLQPTSCCMAGNDARCSRALFFRLGIATWLLTALRIFDDHP